MGAATHAIQQATVDGNLHNGVQFIGQGVALIHDDDNDTIPTVDEILQRILADDRMAAHRVHDLFGENTNDPEDDNDDTTSAMATGGSR